MIRRLGFQRILLIGALIAAMAALVFFSYTIAVPERQNNLRKISTVNSKRSTLEKELVAMRSDMEAFQDRKLIYQRLTRLGFVTTRQGADLQEFIETFKAKSGVLEARADVKSTMPESLSETLDGKYSFSRQPVSVSLTAFDDVDVYRYIYYLNYGLPGIVSITGLTIDRMLDVTPAVLTRIEEGELPEMVRARIDFEWKVIRPETPDLQIEITKLGMEGGRSVTPPADDAVDEDAVDENAEAGGSPAALDDGTVSDLPAAADALLLDEGDVQP